tara:strand:+ start:153953 stop:156307 length:2355 start_codon:yes stop_codon:yes gene_type:complete
LNFFHGLSKAQVLFVLEGKISKAKILPQISFCVRDWKLEAQHVLERVCKADFASQPLIVRSSSIREDTENGSMAGAFESVLNVCSEAELERAINAVVASYGGDVVDDDVVFVQPMLSDVIASGVAFTFDPNSGAPYYIIDYSYGNDTTLTTAGESNDGKTCYVHRDADISIKSELVPEVLALCRELESVTQSSHLDVEFGLNSRSELYLFQVRPLNSSVKLCEAALQRQNDALKEAGELVSRLNNKIPYVTGDKTLLGNMPDWNPAEMIGARPKQLALSLYKEMITDRIWAYQRDNYGYKNLRSVPLLFSVAGSPYIDVRASFFSFIPKMVSDGLASKLVDYYLSQLEEKPELHDKIEFDIVFSCFTPSTPRMSKKLIDAGFTPVEVQELIVALRDLTNRITHPETGEWRVDRGKIDVLKQRQQRLIKGGFSHYDLLFWLAEDCKRYGTLAFAGLARAAFVATQFIKSLQDEGVLSKVRIETFWRSLETVGSSLKNDRRVMSRADFLAKYGHLRPGTYDITSPSYAEAPDRYFQWDVLGGSSLLRDAQGEEFVLTANEARGVQELLDDHGISHTPESLFRFIRAAIEGREYGKFVFSWSINEILKCLEELGAQNGFSREDCAHLNFQTLLGNYSYSAPLRRVMAESISQGKADYATTLCVNLPSLISSKSDIWAFEISNSIPNFVTQLDVDGEVMLVDGDVCHTDLAGKVVLITNADPGYDWLLSAGVRGFITCYGGANSHMAVRAMELGIPAAIGVGERLFAKLTAAQLVELSCSGKRITVLS